MPASLVRTAARLAACTKRNHVRRSENPLRRVLIRLRARRWILSIPYVMKKSGGHHSEFFFFFKFTSNEENEGV